METGQEEKQRLEHVIQLRLGQEHVDALEELLIHGYAPTKPWVIRQALLREAARLEWERSHGAGSWVGNK